MHKTKQNTAAQYALLPMQIAAAVVDSRQGAAAVQECIRRRRHAHCCQCRLRQLRQVCGDSSTLVASRSPAQRNRAALMSVGCTAGVKLAVVQR